MDDEGSNRSEEEIAIGSQVQINGTGPAWIVRSFESALSLCFRIDSSGIRCEVKYPVETLSTAAKWYGRLTRQSRHLRRQ